MRSTPTCVSSSSFFHSRACCLCSRSTIFLSHRHNKLLPLWAFVHADLPLKRRAACLHPSRADLPPVLQPWPAHCPPTRLLQPGPSSFQTCLHTSPHKAQFFSRALSRFILNLCDYFMGIYRSLCRTGSRREKMGPLPLVAPAPRTEPDSWQELSTHPMDKYRRLQDRRERCAECWGAEDLAANSELLLHKRCVETMHTLAQTPPSSDPHFPSCLPWACWDQALYFPCQQAGWRRGVVASWRRMPAGL